MAGKQRAKRIHPRPSLGFKHSCKSRSYFAHRTFTSPSSVLDYPFLTDKTFHHSKPVNILHDYISIFLIYFTSLWRDYLRFHIMKSGQISFYYYFMFPTMHPSFRTCPLSNLWSEIVCLWLRMYAQHRMFLMTFLALWEADFNWIVVKSRKTSMRRIDSNWIASKLQAESSTLQEALLKSTRTGKVRIRM